MNPHQRYAGPSQRTFRQAVVHLLETQYGLLGSERVLSLLAQDVQALAEEFYPQPAHLAPGWMVFTGTRASGKKAHPGQSGGDHELVTLAWPVLLPEDLEELARCGDQQRTNKAWWKKRIIRIMEHGYQQHEGEVLLTQADLGCMLGLSYIQVGKFLQEARQETGKSLLTKGYYFDQGLKPTHKAEIIALYESGLDEAAIAVQSGHAQDSVGQYIRDYERIKLAVKHRMPIEQIPAMIAMQPSLTKAYLELIAQYHPNLLTESVPLPQT
jgi:hypothetical protein